MPTPLLQGMFGNYQNPFAGLFKKKTPQQQYTQQYSAPVGPQNRPTQSGQTTQLMNTLRPSTQSANPAAAGPNLGNSLSGALKNNPAFGTYVKNQQQPIPTYGSTFQGPGGGTNKFDPNTGKPLSNLNPTTDTSPTPKITKKEDSEYIKYLKTMFNPESTKQSQLALENSNRRLADIQNSEERLGTEARRRYETTLDTPGGLKAGAEASAAMDRRRSNQELADLALQESAAARSAGVAKDTYDTYINAGKTVYEAEQAAQKAEKEDSRYTSEQAYKKEQDTYQQGQDKITNDLAEKKFAEDTRRYGLDYALKAKELAISQQKANQDNPNSPSATSAKDVEATNGMNLINSLINNPGIKEISGAIQGGLRLGNINPRSDVQLARNQYNQVKGMLALENRAKLKGQGAVSDFEGRTLESAASSLGRNIGDAEFIRQLKQVRGAIATSHGLTANVLLIDPSTNQSSIVSSDSARIAQAIRDGLIVEYQ